MTLNIFYVLICIQTFFGEMFVQNFCFFIWKGSIFLSLSFESSLFILDISPLSATWFANIVYESVACLFILLTMFFAE